MKFNEGQKQIIDNISGAFLISAPVGTGKTTVLTERLLKALSSGIKPEEILCLTFTNRAAEEMRERIRPRLDKNDFDSLNINTFHGFCAFFIKAEAKALGLSGEFTILDDDERLEILKNTVGNSLEGRENENGNEWRNLIEEMYDYRLNEFYRDLSMPYKLSENKRLVGINESYLNALKEQNALDFDQLVLLTLRGLYQDENLRSKWNAKYKLVQIDEFQDTHLAEYLVIKELAKSHKNIALIGDLDQTIYSWRGSNPYLIAKIFQQHFAPVTEYHLTVNYRFSPALLAAVTPILNNFDSHTKEISSGQDMLDSSDKNEKCISIFNAYDFSEEVSWVVDNLKLLREREPEARVAVLTRTNWAIRNVAAIFSEKGIAHITVDQYDFFRRQEVKDAYAHLRILFNKFDLSSAYRILERPPKSIGLKTIERIRNEGQASGLRVSDFLSFSNYNFSEPFANLIEIWKNGRIVVLDTETTGINPFKDEIVQIYAREIISGQPGEEFHFFIKNSKPVGSSAAIHGLTDEFLAKEGRDAAEVLSELQAFIKNSPVSGHNVIFDLAMLRENGQRQGIVFEFKEYYDTLDIARRLIDSENYKLNTLAKKLNLKSATHSADDDVAATIGLLGELVERLKPGSKQREILFKDLAPKFISLSSMINNWGKVVLDKRPAEALKYILVESGLLGYYSSQPDQQQRLRSLDTLEKMFVAKDNQNQRPEVALQELVRYSALVRNLDFLGLDQGKVPIITVHQVKGLEFDYVFLVNMNEYSFPSYRSDLEEEKRLFYVALTRARKKVFLSYSSFKDGRSLAKSRFLDYLDKRYVE